MIFVIVGPAVDRAAQESTSSDQKLIKHFISYKNTLRLLFRRPMLSKWVNNGSFPLNIHQFSFLMFCSAQNSSSKKRYGRAEESTYFCVRKQLFHPEVSNKNMD